MRFLTPGITAFFSVHGSSLGDLRRAIDFVFGATAAVRVAVAGATVPLLGVVALLMWTRPATVDAVMAGTIAIAWARWLSRQEGQ